MTERPPSIHDENAPVFKIMNDAQLRRIHDSALELLQDPGMQVTTDEARRVLLDAGCSLKGEDVVTFPARLVEDAIASAPKTFTIYDRNGEERAYLGEGRAYFGIGVTSLYFEDPATGKLHDFTLDDFAALARLTDALPGLDFIASPGVVRPSDDVPLSIVNQREFMAMVTNTVKPIMPLVADATVLADIFEMAAIIAGGREQLRERPFVVPYLNSVSPLTLATDTLEKLLLCADWGMPFCCESSTSMGGTGPATIAGTAALSAAETLAGLVLAQARRKGTPYITGSMPMVLNVRTGDVDGGGAPGWLLYLVGIELARFWGLPQVGSGGSSDSKIPDEEASADVGTGILVDILEGVDLSFDAGALEMGLTHSAVLSVIADDAICGMRGMLRGVPVDDEQLALDAIREVGIGGHFLAHPHTLRHFRELWNPGLGSDGSRRDWEAAGSKTLRDHARERTVELIATHRPEPLPAETLAAMEAVIATRRAASPQQSA